jgi:hypothetical protein
MGLICLGILATSTGCAIIPAARSQFGRGRTTYARYSASYE